MMGGSNEYHAVILAAGNSQRLAALTKNIPKSFLEIKGKKLIEYHLDILADRGVADVTIVVGYLNEYFVTTLGDSYRNISLHYVVSKDYATTNHSWSLYLTKERCSKVGKSVLILHADTFYHPRMLDVLLASDKADVLLADDSFSVKTQDELLVYGSRGVVSDMAFTHEDRSGAVGEFIGVHIWSLPFITDFFSFLERFFEKEGKQTGYDRVLGNYLRDRSPTLSYVTTSLPWININHPEDLATARGELYSQIYGEAA